MRATTLVLLLTFAPALRAQSDREIVIISDLHLGIGHRADGTWRPVEDFRWEPEFDLFLAAIGKNEKVDLVLNGDTFDLWQPATPCKGDATGCGIAATREHLTTILAAHADVIAALRQFARAGKHRVIIVPGNHDAGLLIPDVAANLRVTIDGPSDRVLISSGGSFASADGAVYVEHGHQADSVNAYRRWPTPWTGTGTKLLLERPWGEHFLAAFFNTFEKKYPVIDNINDEAFAICTAMVAEGKDAIPDSAQLLKFALLDATRQQQSSSFLSAGTEEESVEWDLDAFKKNDTTLVALLPEPLRTAVRKDHASLPLHAAGLSNDEIQRLCDTAEHEEHEGLHACPVRSLGLEGTLRPSAGAAAWEEYLDIVGKREHSPKIVVFSHTHRWEQPHHRSDAARIWQPIIVNTGAWQRVATKEQFQQFVRARHEDEVTGLRTAQPEDLPPCYSFVVIPAHGAPGPVAQLRFWTGPKYWHEAAKCESDSKSGP